MPNIEGFGNIPEIQATIFPKPGAFKIMDIKRSPPVPETSEAGKEIKSDIKVVKGE